MESHAVTQAYRAASSRRGTPNAQMIKFVFPARDNMPKVAMPEVEVTWYDGGLIPPRPAGLPDGKDLNYAGGKDMARHIAEGACAEIPPATEIPGGVA